MSFEKALAAGADGLETDVTIRSTPKKACFIYNGFVYSATKCQKSPLKYRFVSCCSYDGVPFLMHDKNLRRTTNVKDVFPNWTHTSPAMFTWRELQSLNAGSWFFSVRLRDASLLEKSICCYLDNNLDNILVALNHR